MTAVDAVVEHLKGMSKQVTTPEEIAQASKAPFIMYASVVSIKLYKIFKMHGRRCFVTVSHRFLKKRENAKKKLKIGLRV